jgi:hypothetical protein
MLADFIAAVKNALDTDASIVAWSFDNFGKKMKQLDSYREIEAINANEYPLQLYRVGDGAADLETGNSFTRLNPELIVELLWIENDYDKCMTQVKSLPDLVALALLRNVALNDYGAYMQAWRVGDPRLHPVQTVGFRVVGDYLLMV